MKDQLNYGKPASSSEAMPEFHAASRWNSVISRIAGQGLKSAAQLKGEGASFFPSDDEFPRDRICGVNLFPPTSRKEFEYFLRRLYSDTESVIPVVLERPGEKRTHFDSVRAVPEEVLKQECERRAAASFLVVCRKDAWSIITSIPSEEFDYVLIPAAVYEGYIANLSAVPFPTNVQLRVINDTVKRLVTDKIDVELEVPNYEQALIDILNSGTENIFVHGVRLPLNDEKTLFKKDPSLKRF